MLETIAYIVIGVGLAFDLFGCIGPLPGIAPDIPDRQDIAFREGVAGVEPEYLVRVQDCILGSVVGQVILGGDDRLGPGQVDPGCGIVKRDIHSGICIEIPVERCTADQGDIRRRRPPSSP